MAVTKVEQEAIEYMVNKHGLGKKKALEFTHKIRERILLKEKSWWTGGKFSLN
jgi:hypothetical protein